MALVEPRAPYGKEVAGRLGALGDLEGNDAVENTGGATPEHSEDEGPEERD